VHGSEGRRFHRKSAQQFQRLRRSRKKQIEKGPKGLAVYRPLTGNLCHGRFNERKVAISCSIILT
jgi:hypothetical protein